MAGAGLELLELDETGAKMVMVVVEVVEASELELELLELLELELLELEPMELLLEGPRGSSTQSESVSLP